jgi:hypothetical protein
LTVFAKLYWRCMADGLALVALTLLAPPMPRLLAAIIATVVMPVVAILDRYSRHRVVRVSWRCSPRSGLAGKKGPSRRPCEGLLCVSSYL